MNLSHSPKSFSKLQSVHALAIVLVAGVTFLSNTPLSASYLDDSIQSRTRKSYVFKTFLKEDAIRIDSQKGVVTLMGTVSDAFHQALAGDTAENTAGVKAVINQLTIIDEPIDVFSDDSLSGKLKAMLSIQHGGFSKTEVSVHEGVAFLLGEVSSISDKEFATDYATGMVGVTMVKNLLKVGVTDLQLDGKAVAPIDDASITAMVKAGLAMHHSTSALNTMVNTRECEVTVSGVVKDSLAKGAVTKLVSEIAGVKSVVNNMIIALPLAQL